SNFTLGRGPAEGGIFAVALQRQTVHQEEAHIAFCRFGHKALGDEITFFTHRLEYLLDIGILARSDLEDVLATRPLQRLEDDALLLRIDEAAYFVDALGDEGFGAY